MVRLRRPPAPGAIPETLAELSVPVDSLRPYAGNPRRANLDLLKDSLERHGQYRPIVARKGTGEVLAGNHTLAAAIELGWEEIAATFIDVDDDQAARIVLVDNRSSDLALYDDRALADLLASLDALDGTGYGTGDLEELLALLEPAGLEAAPNGQPPAAAPYALGESELYRIMLSYDRETYEALVARLDELAEKFGVDSYSEVVRELAHAQD